MLVESDQETGADQVGKRCSAPESDSEELVPAASSRDGGKRQGEGHASDLPKRPQTQACAAGQSRPWTRQDTALSKAISRALRHRSNLRLDEAGYANLADVLVHPILRRHRPTRDWVEYIVKANAKQRFALDKAGTRIRAVQGHSIPVDSSKLLRQLESGDIGDMVPTCVLHSTFFSCLPSIMHSGLLPGGTRGTRYRRHVHLAMSHSPTAGLREGSEVILVIDLMRAHNAGCVFYVSDNNVILTEDCIPPPRIARAQYTSTGEAYDLSRLRTAYKMACAAPDLSELALLGLDHSTAWSVTQAQLAHLPCRRCSLRSESGALSLNSRAWTLRPFGQVLDSLAAYRLSLCFSCASPSVPIQAQDSHAEWHTPRARTQVLMEGHCVGQRLPHLRHSISGHTLGSPWMTSVA